MLHDAAPGCTVLVLRNMECRYQVLCRNQHRVVLQRCVVCIHNIWFCCLVCTAQEKKLRLQDDWYKCFQANDTNKDSQNCLLAGPTPVHVFNGLLETLPADEQARIRSMRPPVKAKKEVAAACYEAQKRYMTVCKDVLFPSAARTCLRHPNQCCPLYLPKEAGSRNGNLGPLGMNFSGTMCTPFSPQGPMHGTADASMESLNFWMLKMEQSPLDIVFLENSDRFPFKMFEDVMTQAGRWECHRCVFSTEERQ